MGGFPNLPPSHFNVRTTRTLFGRRRHRPSVALRCARRGPPSDLSVALRCAPVAYTVPATAPAPRTLMCRAWLSLPVPFDRTRSHSLRLPPPLLAACAYVFVPFDRLRSHSLRLPPPLLAACAYVSLVPPVCVFSIATARCLSLFAWLSFPVPFADYAHIRFACRRRSSPRALMSSSPPSRLRVFGPRRPDVYLSLHVLLPRSLLRHAHLAERLFW